MMSISPSFQPPLKHRHRQASAINVYPGQAISINSRFCPLLPFLFLSFLSKFLRVFSYSTLSLKVPFKTAQGSPLFCISYIYPSHFYHLFLTSPLMLLIPDLWVISRFFPSNSIYFEGFFFGCASQTHPY